MSGTSPPPGPSPYLYVSASQAAYGDDIAPGLLDPLINNDGNPTAMVMAEDGFSAQAFVDSSGNVIIAYEGTTILNPLSFAADEQIVDQKTPAAYQDAEEFLKMVTNIVQSRYPNTTTNIYVTGHSLGGAEAEYVASLSGNGGATIAGGATFGAPGLINYPYPNPTPVPNFTDYINYGDPVGSYASDVTEVDPKSWTGS